MIKAQKLAARACHIHVLHKKQYFFFLPKALQNQILDKKIHVKLPLIFRPSFALKEHLFPHTSLIKDDKVSEMSQLSFIS